MQKLSSWLILMLCLMLVLFPGSRTWTQKKSLVHTVCTCMLSSSRILGNLEISVKFVVALASASLLLMPATDHVLCGRGSNEATHLHTCICPFQLNAAVHNFCPLLIIFRNEPLGGLGFVRFEGLMYYPLRES